VGRCLASVLLSGCSGGGRPELPPASFVANREAPSEEYIIGPLDQLNVFVWRNPELSAKVQVRPDGRITTPLISDMPAVGKTPAMLADDMKIRAGRIYQGPDRLGDRREFLGHLQPAGPRRRRDREAGVDPVPRQHDRARRDDLGRRA
jgi:hypothetical protein